MEKIDSEKVVRLTIDAEFYADRAAKSLKRRQYDKALKYYQLALEKEPDNPVHYCNLAGLLSELGRFEESDELLETVLHEVDPELTECLYYMANNAANMGDFELAEDYLLEYISQAPDGEFLDEAEEMLYMVAYEMGRLPKEPYPSKLPEYMEKHEEARWHLEEGRFLQATELLEELVQERPDFLAAQNNLALAYFYLGDIEKAIELIQKVLEKDPNNLHALCNLAVCNHRLGEEQIRKDIIGMLKKLIPVQKEHAYKLATTMGMLGEHTVAYELFTRIIRVEWSPEAILYHYAAVAAANVGHDQQAVRYWKKTAWLDPESEVPRFYLYWMQNRQKEELSIPEISYAYQLPFEEKVNQLHRGKAVEEVIQDFTNQPLLKASMYWGLMHGHRQTKLQVLHILRWVKDPEMESWLKAFLLNSEEEDDLKQIAFFALKRSDAKLSLAVSSKDGCERLRKEAINDKWSQVLECCLEKMANYTKEQRNHAKIFWDIMRSTFHLDHVRKVQALAAVIEYVVAKYYDLPVTQTQIADKYGVSPSTVARNAKLILPLLHQHYKKLI